MVEQPVMVCWIDPSGSTHSVISCFSQCSTTGVTKAVACAILSGMVHKKILVANWKE